MDQNAPLAGLKSASAGVHMNLETCRIGLGVAPKAKESGRKCQERCKISSNSLKMLTPKSSPARLAGLDLASARVATHLETCRIGRERRKGELSKPTSQAENAEKCNNSSHSLKTVIPS